METGWPPIRIANLIEMFKAMVYENWTPPLFVSEELYNEIRVNQDKYPPCLVGYIGFNSYGGKWFGGYRRDSEGKRDYWVEHYNNLSKQIPKLKGVTFSCCSYTDLYIPSNSIIYCDPPYANTTGYKDSFNHEIFWQWVREQCKTNSLFVSEYTAPADFVAVWEKTVNNTLVKETGCRQGVEKLFVYESQL